MKTFLFVGFFTAFLSGCVAGYSELNDGLTAVKEGRKDDALKLFAASCEASNADGCFQQSKLVDGNDSVALLKKSCELSGHLEACFSLGNKLKASNVDQAKGAFAKACSTLHDISQPYTQEEMQAQAQQMSGGKFGALASNLAKFSAASTAVGLDNTAEQCKVYRSNMDMKLAACKEAGGLKPNLFVRTKFDESTRQIVTIPEGTACTKMAH